ncbi:MAG: MFS transporter [Candidatus Eremiobacteraeota bacterium]|nr:MFS transporter [Candidatus Eremiobacteraeota bacterium]
MSCGRCARPSLTKTAKSPIWAILGASSGNLVEWYDFYAYAFTAIYFAHAFFPDGDENSKLLQSAGIFGVGFLMRPLGGWFFGRMADRHGRRTSMLVSVLMMSFGSLMIAVLPTYQSIGVAAPWLLLLARMIQGLSVGGEYGASATYMSEIATPKHRGFYSSFQYMTLIGGQLLASLVVVTMDHVLAKEQVLAWGWRIPFAIGALAALVALFLRRTLVETTTAESRESSDSGTLAGLLKQPAACLSVIGFTGGGSLIFYTYTTYMQKYLVNTAHFEKSLANHVMTGVLFFYMMIQPIFGALSDRVGRKRCMIAFALWGILTTVPLMTAIGRSTGPLEAGCLIALALTGVSLYTSISGIVKAEMFPIETRALGVGLCYAIGNATFGGSAEYAALLLKQQGHESYYFYYVTAMAAVFLLVALRLPDGRTESYLTDYES